MRIAILSDIHDNIWSLETLLEHLEADVLIFCGDFCAPFTVAQIAEAFSGPVHVVFGNNDGDQFLIAKVAAKYEHITLHGHFADLTLDGRRIGVTHYPEIGRALAQGNVYDVVCHGHSHEQLLERTARTLRINPGEVMGRFGRPTYAMYDSNSDQAWIVDVLKCRGCG